MNVLIIIALLTDVGFKCKTAFENTVHVDSTTVKFRIDRHVDTYFMGEKVPERGLNGNITSENTITKVDSIKVKFSRFMIGWHNDTALMVEKLPKYKLRLNNIK